MAVTRTAASVRPTFGRSARAFHVMRLPVPGETSEAVSAGEVETSPETFFTWVAPTETPFVRTSSDTNAGSPSDVVRS